MYPEICTKLQDYRYVVNKGGLFFCLLNTMKPDYDESKDNEFRAMRTRMDVTIGKTLYELLKSL